MPTSFVHNAATTSKLRSVTQIMLQADPSSPEWIRVRSTALNDSQLFAMLQAVWPAVVGAEPQKFALIRCLGGASMGVWLHLLPNSDYEHGCFEVQSL